MDTVTYPDARVKEELTHWLLVWVDVAERREVANLFEVAGIPVAVAVTGEGEELGRIENCVEPAPFRRQLERLRRQEDRQPPADPGVTTCAPGHRDRRPPPPAVRHFVSATVLGRRGAFP